VLDFDEDPDFSVIHEVWGDWEGFLTTSWSHEKDAPKARVITRLAEPIKAEQYKQVFRWADARCKANGLKLDPQCKNPTRIWFPPVRQRKSYDERQWGGLPLPVQSILLGAMKNEEDGFKASWGEFDEETVIVLSNGRRSNITTLAKDMKPGHKRKCHCPFVGEYVADRRPEETNPESAFIRRKQKGAIIVCTSANHGHENPLIRQWKDPDAFAHTTRTPQNDVLGMLKRVAKKDGSLVTVPTPSNLNIILENDREFGDKLWFDEFLRKQMFGRRPLDLLVDVTNTRVWCEEVYNVVFKTQDIKAALQTVAQRNTRHPFREELRKLNWDRKPRLDTWLIEALHLEDTPLHRAYSRKWAIGAVARIMEPGCKLDTVLIVKGPQGYFKSTLFRELAPGRFRDTDINLYRLENAMQQLQGVWLYEWAELAITRGDKAVNQLKNFITSQVDEFRAPYAPNVGSHPRQCVFVGTTNDQFFLHDQTGNRRYWPVEIHEPIDIEWVIENREQMWAEAVTAYSLGEKWHLSGELEKQSMENAQARVTEDPSVTALTAWLARNKKSVVTMDELVERGLKARLGDRAAATRAGTIMHDLGWVKTETNVRGNRLRFYYDPNQHPNKSDAITLFRVSVAQPTLEESWTADAATFN